MSVPLLQVPLSANQVTAFVIRFIRRAFVFVVTFRRLVTVVVTRRSVVTLIGTVVVCLIILVIV